MVHGVDPEDPGHLQEQVDTGAAPEDTGYPLGQLVTIERSLDIQCDLCSTGIVLSDCIPNAAGVRHPGGQSCPHPIHI